MASNEDVWSSLRSFQFEYDSRMRPHVSCVICQGLLYNAQYGPCGCTYCEPCVRQHLDNGGRLCPGDGPDCRTSELLLGVNVLRDPTAAIRVSKLEVKCPLDPCEHRCKISEISEHLRLCEQRSTSCPFRDIGCDQSTVHGDKITDHLLTEIHQHSRLMIEWVANMENEITKRVINKQYDDLQNRLNVLELAVADDRRGRERDVQEISNLRNKNLDLEDIIRAMKESHEEKICKMEEEILQLKTDRDKHAMDIGFLRQATDGKDKDKVNQNLDTSMNASGYRIPQLKSPLASYKWMIKDVSNKRRNRNWIYGESFFSLNNHYSMCLGMAGDGCKNVPGHLGTHVCIGFTITGNSNGFTSIWPLQCGVRVTVKSIKQISLDNKTLSKFCKFEKPSSECFHFANSDIDNLALMSENCLTIICDVEKY